MERSPLVWRLFVISVWSVIVWNAVDGAARLADSETMERLYGEFWMRMALAPFVIAAVELAFWCIAFRHRDGRARMMAVFAGVLFLAGPVLVPLAMAEAYGYPVDAKSLWFHVAAAACHFLFGILDR